MKIDAELKRWLLFSVLLSLIPFAFTILAIWADPKKELELFKLISGGQLLLVTTAFLGTAISEITRIRSEQTTLMFLTFVLMSLASYCFALISTTNDVEPLFVIVTSTVLLISTLFLTGICIHLRSQEHG